MLQSYGWLRSVHDNNMGVDGDGLVQFDIISAWEMRRWILLRLLYGLETARQTSREAMVQYAKIHARRGAMSNFPGLATARQTFGTLRTAVFMSLIQGVRCRPVSRFVDQGRFCLSLNSGGTVQYKLNAQSLRLFGLHDNVNDAHRASKTTTNSGY